jgi:glycine/serine hydroxymethyltransferase
MLVHTWQRNAHVSAICAGHFMGQNFSECAVVTPSDIITFKTAPQGLVQQQSLPAHNRLDSAMALHLPGALCCTLHMRAATAMFVSTRVRTSSTRPRCNRVKHSCRRTAGPAVDCH